MSINDLEAQKAYYKNLFIGDQTVIFRDFESSCGQVKCCLIFIDGMINHERINRDIILPIQHLNLEKKKPDLDLLSYLEKRIIISDDVSRQTDVQENVKKILYGDTALLVEGFSDVLIIQSKGWEKRGIDEPDSERIIYGPKEAFTESVLTNISLLRRRLQTPKLKFEGISLGKLTGTKVYLCYLDGIAPTERVEEMKRRLGLIHLDAILSIQDIGESITNNPYSIFKLNGYTERPDVTVSKLLEGRVIVACDGSPEILYAPYFFCELFFINEDYYNNYIFSLINRILRIIAFILTTSGPSIYISLIGFHQQMLPREIFMSIAAARKGVPFSSTLELVLLLTTFSILREAGTRLPKNIGSAISIVGALILGEAAVRAQIFSAPIIIVVALSGISSMMLMQMAEALIVIRFGLLAISSFFGLYGFIFGVMFLTAYMFSLDSFGDPFMTYVYNFRLNRDNLIRLPIQNKKVNTQKK